MSKILFLGPEGSFSYKAAINLLKLLPDHYDLDYRNSFAEIHNDILNNNNIGVLPIENSISTNIYENVEFLFDNDIYIIGEYFLPIELNLIGHKDANIKDLNTIYSHPKALKQCSEFINNNHLNTIESTSTSSAQKTILELDNSNFAIGNEIISNKLEIKQRNIGNYNNNKTRFIFVSRNEIKLKTATNRKISFICKLKHEQGTLLELLNIISENNINLMKIESKPIPNSEFEYLFLIEGVKDKEINLERAQDILNKHTILVKILGVY